MPELASRLHQLQCRISGATAPAAGRSRLLAVSKTRGIEEIAALAALGQLAFGENYVQEALPKIAACAADPGLPGLEWHLIGRLQSNKAREAAHAFDWVQTVDRAKLADALSRHRDPARPALNVLIQVNVDGEPGKGGCEPHEVPALATHVAALPRLALRGLMAIPAPVPDPSTRRAAFRSLAALQTRLAATHPGLDTLSMGMSDDFELALAEGATLVRIGTALFGPRPPKPKQAATTTESA
ncbi:YggS family pyridoxal phosphate-dependent enzyme [Coralloluteibacterium stylophorae]|uniref:Pyridoxal phosphate homeostasis protein n=1 Tax=Coralloluteibacterium stylophorae TaxID=1776034 RepID=A0A8J7VTW5_9GAMM|nr:YggS family pyridoxal phosphate-dependent enzyme [Coralloluteibacterium stylophorae]MBS7456077.1 YggS family pyridoxal phosphate-dependent enzyme [Coralloluteibacterium stylophorae]